MQNKKPRVHLLVFLHQTKSNRFGSTHTGTKLSGERSENSENLTLGSTAMLGFAGTEIRHDFLVREDLLQWSSHGPQG